MANVLDTVPQAEGEKSPDSPAAVLAALAALIALESDGGLSKDGLRELARRDPLDSLLVTVLGGGLLFHLAEKDVNPRCATLYDAILYAATSLSVGYDDVFPKTAIGHLVGTAVQTFGPALSSAAFDPPQRRVRADEDEPKPAASSAETTELLAVNRQILARLEEIAEALKTR
ncbi:MAG: potassium channel family protein [Polyangiaceae bacterium]